MNNDNVDSQNTTIEPTISRPNDAALDTLFAQARTGEPDLYDQNLTKVVLNSLPANPGRTQARSVLFDVIGLIIGVIAAYWFFDGAQLVNSALAFVPESLAITVANVASVFGAAIGVACLGWWTAEKAIS